MSSDSVALNITKIPYEVEAVWRLYLMEGVGFWQCLRCGCEYPEGIIVRCPLCDPPAPEASVEE